MEQTIKLEVSAQEATQKAREDLNFLAALALEEQFLFLFPPLFITIWELLKKNIGSSHERLFNKIAIGIPRGFAKTTLVKIWVIYCILFTEKKCIIICANSQEHGVNIIKDVCDMLDGHNIKSLFGDWALNIERNQAHCKIFPFRGRKIALGAIGATGTIRGLNLGNARPDVMIFEDFQSREDSESEELSNKLYQKMVGTFMKACSPFGCCFIFVANMYPTVGSILKKLKNNKDWMSFIVGAMLSDGTSLWEDLQPIAQLIDEYEADVNAGCPEVFLAEKLNDETAGIKAGIDITAIPEFPWDEKELPQGRAIVIDPATDNPNADYNGIGLVGIYDGKGVLEEVDLEHYTPMQLIKRALLMGFRTNTRLICVENVALQSTYLFWFEEVCRMNSIDGFYFMPLNVGMRSKNGKIRSALEQLQKKEIFIKKAVRGLLINEIIKWNPIKRNNSDTCLDLLSFVDLVMNQHGDLMYMPWEAEMNVPNADKVYEIEDNCAF